MTGWPLVTSMTADTSVAASALPRPGKSTWFTQMFVRRLGRKHVGLLERRAAWTQEPHADLRLDRSRVLQEIEQVEPADRRAFGEIPGEGRRRDRRLGVCAISVCHVPGHRPIDDERVVRLDRGRKLGAGQTRDRLEIHRHAPAGGHRYLRADGAGAAAREGEGCRRGCVARVQQRQARVEERGGRTLGEIARERSLNCPEAPPCAVIGLCRPSDVPGPDLPVVVCRSTQPRDRDAEGKSRDPTAVARVIVGRVKAVVVAVGRGVALPTQHQRRGLPGRAGGGTALAERRRSL